MSSHIQMLFSEEFITQSISQFIRKLYLVLEIKKYEEVISWDLDNRMIIIKNTSKIVSQMLQQVFKQRTLRSFIRQLNMYNFKKIKKKSTNSILCFQNVLFAKGNLQNLVFIKRKQRGYVQKDKLQKDRQVDIYKRYMIYTKGVINTITQQISKLKKFPELFGDLDPIIKKIDSSKPLIPQNIVNNSNISFSIVSQTTDNQIEVISPQSQKKKGVNMFESFQSLYHLPTIKSNFSSL